MGYDTKNKLVITGVCVILGTLLTIQFKTFDELDSDIMSTQRTKQIAIEYKKLKTEKGKLLKEINNLEKKVSEYEKSAVDKSPFLENLYDDIEKYKMLSGYEAVKGEGVIIEIDDPKLEVQLGDDKSLTVEHYSLLLEILSLLNAVETEAISINEQRYTAFTEIVPAGNVLEINGISSGTPLVIKAIGNSEDIENALRIKGGIIWLMEEGYNLQIKITRKDNINIPKYKKVKEFKYATPVPEKRNNLKDELK